MLNGGVIAQVLYGIAGNVRYLQRRGEIVEIQVNVGACHCRHLAGLFETVVACKCILGQRFRLGEVEIRCIVILVEARKQRVLVVAYGSVLVVKPLRKQRRIFAAKIGGYVGRRIHGVVGTQHLCHARSIQQVFVERLIETRRLERFVDARVVLAHRDLHACCVGIDLRVLARYLRHIVDGLVDPGVFVRLESRLKPGFLYIVERSQFGFGETVNIETKIIEVDLCRFFGRLAAFLDGLVNRLVNGR